MREVFAVPEPTEGAVGGTLSIQAISFDGSDFQWLVPAAALSVPGLLIVAAVALQMVGGAVWIPIVRRRLGEARHRRSGASRR